MSGTRLLQEPGESGRPRGAETERRSPWVLVVLGLAVFTYAFQQTAVIPVIPTIRVALHATAAWSAWLLSGYLMVATAVTPVFGRLGDLHGAARVLTVALSVFWVGSVAAAFVPGLPAVVASRAVQGTGGAVLPLSFAVARRELPDGSVGRAIAGLTAVFGVGSIIGFATGGLMTEAVSWRLVFGSGAAVVAVALLMLRRVVPRRGGVAGSLDLGGSSWLGATSVTVLVALTIGQQVGWRSPLTILLLVASAVAAGVWVRTEVRHPEPLVDLRVLRNRVVLAVNGATVGLGWARFATLLLVPVLVQARGRGYGFGAGPFVTGLYLVPSGVGQALGGTAAGALGRRVQPGRVLAVGLVIVAAGAVLLAIGLTSMPAVLVASFVLGLGSGLSTQSSSAVTTRDVPSEAAGASASLNSTVRRFSGGVGGQVSIVVLAAVASGAVSSSGFVAAFGLAAAVALAGAGFLTAVARRSPGPTR